MIPPQATEEVAENLRRKFGLDKPVIVNTASFYREAVFGFDLGTSQKFIRPVNDLLSLRIWASLQLAAASMVVALTIAIPLGIYSAVRRGSRFDYAARAFSIAGGSVPSFLVGLLMIRVFAVDLRWFPIAGRDEALSIVLPAFTLGWFASAAFMRLTRSSMLEVLDTEYVKLARIKGVRESVVVWKHALKNALLPVVTYSTVIFAAIVGGAIVVETVFALAGARQAPGRRGPAARLPDDPGNRDPHRGDSSSSPTSSRTCCMRSWIRRSGSPDDRPRDRRGRKIGGRPHRPDEGALVVVDVPGRRRDRCGHCSVGRAP